MNVLGISFDFYGRTVKPFKITTVSLVSCSASLPRAYLRTLQLSTKNVFQDGAVLSSWLFWFGLIAIPVATLLFDVAYRIYHHAKHTSVVDTVRRMESLGITDLDVFLEVTKPRIIPENDTLLSTMNHSIATTSSQPSHHQRGYAFSQDESGALGQAAVVSLYGSTENAPQRVLRLSAATLEKIHPSHMSVN